MRLQCNPPNTTHDLDLLEPELWHRRASGPFQWSLTVWCIVADGSPMSWWLDREGERRSYWGGFLPGVQQCSCSLEENCVDMNYFCNCDADTDAWYVSQARNSFFIIYFYLRKEMLLSFTLALLKVTPLCIMQYISTALRTTSSTMIIRLRTVSPSWSKYDVPDLNCTEAEGAALAIN